MSHLPEALNNGDTWTCVQYQDWFELQTYPKTAFIISTYADVLFILTGAMPGAGIKKLHSEELPVLLSGLICSPATDACRAEWHNNLCHPEINS